MMRFALVLGGLACAIAAGDDDQLFAMIDKDGDGTISQDEADAYRNKIGEAMSKSAKEGTAYLRKNDGSFMRKNTGGRMYSADFVAMYRVSKVVLMTKFQRKKGKVIDKEELMKELQEFDRVHGLAALATRAPVPAPSPAKANGTAPPVVAPPPPATEQPCTTFAPVVPAPTTEQPCTTFAPVVPTTVTTTPPCEPVTVTTTPATTITTTPAPTDAPCTTIVQTPAPTPAPTDAPCTTFAPVKVVNTDPCAAQVAGARKYNAKEASLVQAATKQESGVPAWAFPFFGVVAMFSFVTFLAARVRRRTRATRELEYTEPGRDAEALIGDEGPIE